MKTKIGEKMGQELVEGLNSGEVAPKKKSNTYNRGLLKREIVKGEWLVKRKYRYTDDYAWDAGTNFGETDFVKAGYFPSLWAWLDENKLILPHPNDQEQERREMVNLYEKEKKEATEGLMVFDESDFKGYGHAWKEADGTVTLFFGHQSFQFKRANQN